MKGNLKRMCAAVAAAAGLTFACTVPAAAYSDEAAQQEQALEAEEELWPLEEQEPGETESTPFSMPGNGELVDDVDDGGTSKQFLTVQTKNGNTFYIVVDRSGSTENVYMLSLVDENDLAEFIETADSGEDTAALEITEPALDLETSADEEAGDGQVSAPAQMAPAIGGGAPDRGPDLYWPGSRRPGPLKVRPGKEPRGSRDGQGPQRDGKRRG